MVSNGEGGASEGGGDYLLFLVAVDGADHVQFDYTLPRWNLGRGC